MSDGFSEIRLFFRILMVDVNIGGFGIHGSRGNETALDQLVRDMLQEMTVFKGARLMLTGVADKVTLLHSMVEDLVPLRTGRKASAATAAQPGFLNFADDVVGGQFFQTLPPGFIPAGLEVGVDFPGCPFKLLQYPWLR